MSKKDVNAIVSGAGWIGGVVDKLVKELRKRGIADEAIHSLATENSEVPVGEIADVLAEHFRKSAKPLFPITVDYDLSVEDAVKVGHYDKFNPKISSNNFPPQDGERGKKEVEIELLHFNRYIDNKAALKEIERRGLRPANLRELLALGEKYPDLQLKSSIAALGSSWRVPGGGIGIPSLSGFKLEREVKLYEEKGFWPDFFRFAVVQQSSPESNKKCIFRDHPQ